MEMMAFSGKEIDCEWAAAKRRRAKCAAHIIARVLTGKISARAPNQDGAVSFCHFVLIFSVKISNGMHAMAGLPENHFVLEARFSGTPAVRGFWRFFQACKWVLKIAGRHFLALAASFASYFGRWRAMPGRPPKR